MRKNMFMLLLSLFLLCSTFILIAPVSAKTSQKLAASPEQGTLCGEILAQPKPLERKFQLCRYELDQFQQAESNLQTIKNQLNGCPTHECFLQWGEILDHVRGEIRSNMTLVQRRFDLSKEVRMKWEQAWEKIDKEENKVRRDAYNKGLQRQRSTHESDYLTLE